MASSALLVAQFVYEQPHFAWVAFVPLLIGTRAAGVRRASLFGLLCGWVFEAATTAWFVGWGVSLPAYLLMAALCALRFGVLGALTALPWGAWRLAVLPGAWVLLEYLRLHQGPLSAPWGLIGYSQASFLPAARLAAWAGVYGVSFAIVAANVAIAEAVSVASGPQSRRISRLRRVAPSLAVLALSAVLMASQARPSDASVAVASGRAVQVLAVQGGTYRIGSGSQLERIRVVERYRRMSREAGTPAPDLVVWPEASFPAAIPADAGAVRTASAIAKELGSPLLLAASGADKTTRGKPGRVAANSAFLVDPRGGIRARYDKVRLLPFNEYVPLRGVIRWPDWIVPDLVDAVPGREWTHFDLDGYRFAVLICGENLFPHDFRSASEGADFVVSLTNEAFTDSQLAHRLLLDMNRFRAIESGVWIVRAATTADSAGIAPSGELVARVAWPENDGAEALGTVSLDFVPSTTPTFYRRFGDWLVALQALLLPAIALGRARRLRRHP